MRPLVTSALAMLAVVTLANQGDAQVARIEDGVYVETLVGPLSAQHIVNIGNAWTALCGKKALSGVPRCYEPDMYSVKLSVRGLSVCKIEFNLYEMKKSTIEAQARGYATRMSCEYPCAHSEPEAVTRSCAVMK